MDKSLNWREDLPKFNLLFAKMLYMIYFLFENKQIDPEMKKKLKEFVIQENPKMFEAFELFEKNESLTDLLSSLKKIYSEDVQNNVKQDYSKSIIHKAFESTIKNGTPNQEENTDDDIAGMCSPVNGFMDKKKKSKGKNRKKENSDTDNDTETFISRAMNKMKNNTDSDDS